MSEAKAAHEADDGQVELEFTEEAQEVEIESTRQIPRQARNRSAG